MDATKQFQTLKELVVSSGLSEATIRRRVKDGTLPYEQVGGPGKRLLFPLDAIERAGCAAQFTDAGLQEAETAPPAPSQSVPGRRPAWTKKLPQRQEG